MIALPIPLAWPERKALVLPFESRDPAEVLVSRHEAANRSKRRLAEIFQAISCCRRDYRARFRLSIADAQASIQDTVNEATVRNEIALSEAGVAKEVTYEDLLRSTFGSRWADPVDTARPTGFQSGRRSLAVAGFETKSFEAADRLVANASSPADALGILLASAGSALVLLGLCGRLFLSQRDQSSTPEYPTPLHLPSFEGGSEYPVYANAPGDLDASAERDLYGIPSATPESPERGAVFAHAPTPLFMPGKSRPSISANAAHGPPRLAETAFE